MKPADRPTDMIDGEKLRAIGKQWGNAVPFAHAVIDDFFDPKIAHALADEFPPFGNELWNEYNNPIEIKKTCNAWDKFPPTTYRAFWLLSLPTFVGELAHAVGADDLVADVGLNGGGWHIHACGGKLNPHLDYSMHPKLNYQRRINLLVYLNPDWQSEWGGRLGFYADDGGQPGELVKAVEPKFNRAVIFDTRNSWHGLCDAITCPPDQYRKSLAMYFLSTPPADADRRGKALFAPTADQRDDPEIAELIRKRSRVESADEVSRK